MKQGFWKNFADEIKKRNMASDVLNVVLGIIMVALIILFIAFPGQSIFLVLLFIMAGLMNLQTGLMNFKRPGKRNSGMCFMMMGAVMLFLGVMLLKSMWNK